MILSAADLEEASMATCKQAQVESFKDDYKELVANQASSSNSSLLPLQSVLFDRIMRDGGLLTKVPIPYEARHQALLSPGHLLSRLIAQDIHKRYFR